jgi:hypothetical protein
MSYRSETAGKSKKQPASHVVGYSNSQALEALWTLSGFSSDKLNIQELSSLIGDAPDPETACRVITKHMDVASEVLERKWRKIISQTWLERHPQVSTDITLPLTSKDVARVPVLQDAHALLDELSNRPAAMVRHGDEWLIDSSAVPRLAQSMPSLRHNDLPAVENEWAYVPLRRLRGALQALRLLRLYKGKLVVVNSRYRRWQQLPLPQQFYAIWHVDVYHVDWAQFAGPWHRYINLMQNYLPLIWEMGEGLEAGHTHHIHDVTKVCLEVFRPLWQQERLMLKPTAQRTRTFFDIYEQCALPAITEKLLVGDVFTRYGLLEIADDLTSLFHRLGHPDARFEGNVRWTRVGEVILQAERHQKLPCGLALLDG